MTAITIERTARKPHTCARCRRAITPGERYLECNLTPGDSDIGNDVWWRQRVHPTYVDCQTYPCESRCAVDPEGPVPCRLCEVTT